MRKVYCLFLFIFISILFQELSAQDINRTISGFIADKTSGSALIGSNILLYKDSLTTDIPPLRGTASNSYGYYAIPRLTPGQYYLIARHIGYQPYAEKIIIETNHIQLDIQLISEEIELGEVVVKDKSKDEIAISTVNIDPEFLEHLPSLSGEVELFKSLELLPGVKTASETSSGLYIRGGSPDQTLVLVDGMILYNPAHLGNFSTTFNSDAIQSVKLIKGAFPARYGGRLSSVLDVKLRSGTKEKEKGMIGIGTLSSRILVEGPINEKSTYMFSARKMYYDVLQKNILDAEDVPRYNFHDLNLKVSYNLSDSDILWIDGILTEDNLYSEDDEEEIGYDIDWRNRAINLNWLKINSKSIFLNTSLSYIDFRFRSIIEDNTPNSTASDYFSSSALRDFVLKTTAEMHLRNNHIIRAGTEITIHDYTLIYNDYYDEQLEDYLNKQDGILTAEAALFFENDWQISSKLRTNLGARFYYFKAQDYFQIEPRASLNYMINDNIHINGAFAIANQFLHLITRNDISLPTDLWYPSSEEINPARSIQYILGIDSYFKEKKYRFSVEGYYKDMKNLYEFENAISIQPGESVEDALVEGVGEAYGVEFFFHKQKGRLSGWIGYTLSWTKRKFDELNRGKVFYPRYDRRHDISFVSTYKLTDRVTLSATWSYATGQGYTMPIGKYQFGGIGVNKETLTQIEYSDLNAHRFSDYHKLDLGMQYQFSWGSTSCEAFLNFYNVYNRQNPFAYYITNNGNKTVMKKMTLFPFIPTVGMNIRF